MAFHPDARKFDPIVVGHRDAIKVVFDKLDKNKNGYLEKEELKDIVAKYQGEAFDADKFFGWWRTGGATSSNISPGGSPMRPRLSMQFLPHLRSSGEFGPPPGVKELADRAGWNSDDESEDGSDDDNGSPPTPRPTQSFDRRRLTVDQRSTTAADLEAIAKQYNEGRAEAKAKGGKSPTSPSGKKGGFSLFGRSK